MSIELKKSKTWQNLQTAFAGESQAFTKYQYFASRAKKDGYIKIQQLFTEAANNEKEHAKVWFKLLRGGNIPATAENLKEAAAGEKYEWREMYRQFAQEARDEGFNEIARLFEMVGKVEARHEQQFLATLEEEQHGTLFKQTEEVYWICTNCGHVVKGLEPPKICPLCAHARDYYVIKQ